MRKNTVEINVFILGLSVFCMIMVLACTQKTVPVITTRSTNKIVLPLSDSVVTGNVQIGKSIFTTRCNRCHDLPDPAQYAANRWEGILSYMIPRARLTANQGIHVSAYIKMVTNN